MKTRVAVVVFILTRCLAGAMYSVVHFTDMDDVAVVPTDWISDGMSVWPPYKSTARITRAVRETENPGLDWERYSCRVLSSADSYEVARRRERRAEEVSDLTTDDDSVKKRTRKVPLRLLSSSEDEDNAEVVQKAIDRSRDTLS
ncbi:uncharacterized protein LOC135376412 [Ornithodoros turicata]|uniref:uncharacterized protein LOC135376412 n=1 Tax=Ornithodoros turicata TaxID=34597 RepID=UPI003138E20A